jgi:hypothetical protein
MSVRSVERKVRPVERKVRPVERKVCSVERKVRSDAKRDEKDVPDEIDVEREGKEKLEAGGGGGGASATSKVIVRICKGSGSGCLRPYSDLHVPERRRHAQPYEAKIDTRILANIQAGQAVEVSREEILKWQIMRDDRVSHNRRVPWNLKIEASWSKERGHTIWAHTRNDNVLNDPNIKRRIRALDIPMWSFFGDLGEVRRTGSDGEAYYKFPTIAHNGSGGGEGGGGEGGGGGGEGGSGDGRSSWVVVKMEKDDANTHRCPCYQCIESALNAIEIGSASGLVFFPEQAARLPYQCWGLLRHK